MDVPEGGDKFAAKTVVDAAAGAGAYFGTGLGIPAMDLSGATEIRFWIKTDMKSAFNVQIHNDDNRVSVFRFSTVDFEPETWKEITAPVASFAKARWSKGEADWAQVNKWQSTAFGSGPYNGNYIIVDNLVAGGKRSMPASAKPAVSVKKDGPVERGGAIKTQSTESPTAAKSPPEGFRSFTRHPRRSRSPRSSCRC